MEGAEDRPGSSRLASPPARQQMQRHKDKLFTTACTVPRNDIHVLSLAYTRDLQLPWVKRMTDAWRERKCFRSPRLYALFPLPFRLFSLLFSSLILPFALLIFSSFSLSLSLFCKSLSVLAHSEVIDRTGLCQWLRLMSRTLAVAMHLSSCLSATHLHATSMWALRFLSMSPPGL